MRRKNYLALGVLVLFIFSFVPAFAQSETGFMQDLFSGGEDVEDPVQVASENSITRGMAKMVGLSPELWWFAFAGLVGVILALYLCIGIILSKLSKFDLFSFSSGNKGKNFMFLGLVIIVSLYLVISEKILVLLSGWLGITADAIELGGNIFVWSGVVIFFMFLFGYIALGVNKGGRALGGGAKKLAGLYNKGKEEYHREKEVLSEDKATGKRIKQENKVMNEIYEDAEKADKEDMYVIEAVKKAINRLSGLRKMSPSKEKRRYVGMVYSYLLSVYKEGAAERKDIERIKKLRGKLKKFDSNEIKMTLGAFRNDEEVDELEVGDSKKINKLVLKRNNLSEKAKMDLRASEKNKKLIRKFDNKVEKLEKDIFREIERKVGLEKELDVALGKLEEADKQGKHILRSVIEKLKKGRLKPIDLSVVAGRLEKFLYRSKLDIKDINKIREVISEAERYNSHILRELKGAEETLFEERKLMGKGMKEFVKKAKVAEKKRSKENKK